MFLLLNIIPFGNSEKRSVNNISGVKLRARATGTLSNANLNALASVKKASSVVGGTSGGNTPSGGGSGSGSTGSGDEGPAELE